MRAPSDVTFGFGEDDPETRKLVEAVAIVADETLNFSVIDWKITMGPLSSGCNALLPLEYVVRLHSRLDGEALSVACCPLGLFRSSQSIRSFPPLV